MVSQKLLDELKQIIFEDYGVLLTAEEISEIGNSLVQFFELLINIEQEQNYGENI